MNITYFEQLSKAWKRMVVALFKPFDISKWFAVGFTAFLAGLMDGGGGNGSNTFKDRDYNNFPDDIHQISEMIYQWLLEHPGWTIFIGIVILIIIIICVLFTWLSSRGKFMFLHNVIHDNKEIKKPWHEYEKEGNSLFLWRLAFGFVVFCIVIFFVLYTLYMIFNIRYMDFHFEMLFPFIGMGLLFMFVMTIAIYIGLFLNDFVVPIMYKNKISTNQAWAKFMELFKQHFWHFILYGLFILLLVIITVIAVVLAGVFTCCIGFILMIIPYIGSVLLLPVSYTFRGLSVEFLEQFGDDYKLFPKEEESAPNDLGIEQG